MRRSLELLRLRLGRIWLVILALSTLGTGLSLLRWKYDILEMGDDERGAYDNGLKDFTLPKRWLLKTLQERYGVAKPHQSTEVVVVALDDATMSLVAGDAQLRQRYGANLPFDRTIWADLVKFLSRAGARVVAFDMVMNEQSSDGTGDLALASALKTSSVPVVLGFNTSPTAVQLQKVEATATRPVGPMPPPPTKETPEGEFPAELTPEEQKALDERAAQVRLEWAAKAYAMPVDAVWVDIENFPTVVERDAAGKPTGVERAHFPMPAVGPMLESMQGFGTVTSEEDEDGKLRRTSFAYTDGANTYVTLPVAALVALDHAPKVRIEPGHLVIGTRRVRINSDGSAEINYGGRLFERFRVVSLGEVVQRMLFCEAREAPTPTAEDFDCPEGPTGALFKDKVVVVGGIAVGTGDSKATPLDQSSPGLVKQAAVLDNLLRDDFIIEAPLWMSVIFAFFVAFISATLVLVVRNTFIDIGFPVLLYYGFFLVTGGVLVTTHLHLLSAMPGFAGALASVFSSAWERLFSRKDRERLKEMFSSYMESDLVELMVEQRQLPTLDGENMEVTAFFSDIKGFSTFSELLKDKPRTLIKVLNRYLSVVTPALTNEGACIDKYIGDAVVALFGAPVRHQDHALRACRAALDVQKVIAELRLEFRREGLPDVYTRIGLNTGAMMVGNIGSEQLLDYTAIGDEMNLAARLEGANKAFDTLIMLGPGTVARVGADIEVRELDRVRVAGKKSAVTVFELLALKGQVDPLKRKVVDLYAQALLAYRGRSFEEARDLLTNALQLQPTDGPSRRLITKCEGLLAEPPGDDWEAVSELEK